MNRRTATRKPSTPTSANALQRHWARMQPRERRLITLAALTVSLALLWVLVIAPPLRTLRQAPAQLAEAQAQVQHMQALQREANALKALPTHKREQAMGALQQATEQRLGQHARLNVTGQRVQIQFEQAPAADLAAWLADIRANARIRPSNAQLRRTRGSDEADSAHWHGTLELSLP